MSRVFREVRHADLIEELGRLEYRISDTDVVSLLGGMESKGHLKYSFGIGMTPEVQSHLFEPFFTRRR
jgi:signal transduction histidine kinase